ncbi:MAG TPA: hypothetical protein VF065_11295 [Ilumatobacter sp.]
MPDSANEASVSLEVGPDAMSAVVIAFGGELDEATLDARARTIDGDVFAGAPATSNVKADGRGIPLLDFTSSDVFEPGDAPTIELDTRRLCDDLIAAGITNIEVRLALPNVDANPSILPESESGMTWHVRSCSESPRGALVLRPDPGEFWRSFLLVTVVVAANVALAAIGWRGISVLRWVTIGLSAAAVVAAFVMIATAGATAGDNMEVAGRMGHGANQLYFVAALVIVLLGPIAAVAQPLYWRLPRDQRPRLRRRSATT